MAKQYKIVVYVPESHAEKVRQALGDAGAGEIGNYTHCTFTVTGTGRFKPEAGANPRVGEVGKLEAVSEERIETVCKEEVLKQVIKAVRDIHPDEEPAMDVYPIELVE
ncbi:hypothetical protein H7X87_01585 [Acetobacteraceae bacterium]|nr:hypothetical protein [Candidatus Parcubacteria bacterium]